MERPENDGAVFALPTNLGNRSSRFPHSHRHDYDGIIPKTSRLKDTHSEGKVKTPSQDDVFVGVLNKNIPNKSALIGRSPGYEVPPISLAGTMEKTVEIRSWIRGRISF
jgi:hypothetical protein